jgi:hypothetical protein
MTILDEDLLRLNRQGLIPGPQESENDFIKRVDYCLNLKSQMSQDIDRELPLSYENLDKTDLISSAFPKTKRLFDLSPNWIPLFFSNYKLSPWHGGCAWIFKATEESPVGAFFQLRQAFRTSAKYLKMYDRDELIAHELAHVGRMMFEEPKFEELLSYRTANSNFRRWFGPIIQSSWESMLFVIVLLITFIIEISTLNLQNQQALEIAMWLKMIPIGFILFAGTRLFWKQNKFSSCLKKLKEIFHDERTANAVVYRLIDREILAFAKMTGQEIIDYAREQDQNSLRWHLIYKAYFQSGN